MFALEVNDLCKTFHIYAKPVDRLKEVIFRKPFRKDFESLRHLSLSLPMGQTLGIIGDNGAGKSTLLKILAGTLTPSSGKVTKYGKVAALLELGSGFNPEFSGRENIYLNGALLGFSKSDIKKKETNIIDFSGIGDFIDQPVKTYSSGMYVRLAFSIATSVNPDILIIDEALSVGDQSFQKKCVDRMMDFQKSGKTILFCSHSMYHVNTLCERAIWLVNGQIKMTGVAKEVTKAYEEWGMEKNKSYAEDTNSKLPQQENSTSCLVRDVSVAVNGQPTTELAPGQDVVFDMNIDIFKDIQAHVGFGVMRSDELLCFCAMTNLEGAEPHSFAKGSTISVKLNIKNFSLLDGTYRVLGGLVDEHGLHFYHIHDSHSFTIKSNNYNIGIVTFPCSWQVHHG